MTEQRYDIAIIGAGIVGLATAMELMGRFPSLRLAVLEKEQAIGQHQTGHCSTISSWMDRQGCCTCAMPLLPPPHHPWRLPS